MTSSKKDPTEPIRLKASLYPEVDKGTACTQSSFKAQKRAFLYIGPQGGRYKAMFKLQASMAEAERLAKKDPDRFEIGVGGWVTTRFTTEEPLPKKLWEKWLDESYVLSLTGTSKKKVAKTAKKQKVSTKAAKKATKKTARKTMKKKVNKKRK